MGSSQRTTGSAEARSTAPPVTCLSSNAAAGISLQERERLRIGFDLHDGPAQTMSAALLQVKMLQDLEGDALRCGLAELRSTISAGMEEVYELIERLGGRDSTDDDLQARVRSAVDSFSDRCDIEVDLLIDGDDCGGSVSPSMQIAVARIVQEALSNVSRHSGASHASVALHLSPTEVVCEVTDDGAGFAREELGVSRRGRQPFGLHSMRERARLLDGECVVDSAPGMGTRVCVRIPVWRP